MPERVGEGLRALVVDDEEVVRSVVLEVLEGMGFLANPAESLTAGRERLAGERYDLLIIDKNLPDGSGLSLAREVAEGSLDAQVVIISGYATLSSAVEALQAGVAAFPEHAQDADTLIAAAATSLDAAKQAGRNRLICWSRELSAGGRLDSAQVRHEADKLVALQRSIRERSFQSVYQPIVDLAAGTEVAWEALTRPMDPAFTSVLDLLGTAERSGQVPTLGRVLRAIQIAAIHKLPPDKLLFLNVHPFEFLEPDAIESEPALRPWTKRVVLELTEAAELSNFARARERVAALRAAGFRIAVDDLGSGYSSLNHLALLEPDFVKVDMAMIRGIEEGSRAARLIKHILEYCRGEGMRAVCEGIETPEELRVVAALGVSLVQGYLLARPGPPFPRATVELPSNPPPPKGARRIG